MVATRTGFLGTRHDNLANIVSRLERFGLCDERCSALLRDAEAYGATLPQLDGLP